jgi:hypothetical protein
MFKFNRDEKRLKFNLPNPNLMITHSPYVCIFATVDTTLDFSLDGTPDIGPKTPQHLLLEAAVDSHFSLLNGASHESLRIARAVLVDPLGWVDAVIFTFQLEVHAVVALLGFSSSEGCEREKNNEEFHAVAWTDCRR